MAVALGLGCHPLGLLRPEAEDRDSAVTHYYHKGELTSQQLQHWRKLLGKFIQDGHPY